MLVSTDMVEAAAKEQKLSDKKERLDREHKLSEKKGRDALKIATGEFEGGQSESASQSGEGSRIEEISDKILELAIKIREVKMQIEDQT